MHNNLFGLAVILSILDKTSVDYAKISYKFYQNLVEVSKVNNLSEARVELPQVPTFINHANDLKNRDKGLDLLYDNVDQLMKDGRFCYLNSLLYNLNAQNYSTDILIGLLVSTLPVKTKLSSRPDFLSRVKEILYWRGDWTSDLLTGL